MTVLATLERQRMSVEPPVGEALSNTDTEDPNDPDWQMEDSTYIQPIR